MGIFGWSYPPGCSGPPEDDYDDTVCYFCGAELPETDGTEHIPGWLDEGFCSQDHLTRANAGEVLEDGTWTVAQFCEHIGVSPIVTALRAIDKYNTESVDICVNGKWYAYDDDVSEIREDSRISAVKVRGIAWDGSDWEFGEVVESSEGLSGLDAARQRFEDALDEYEAERDAEAEDEDQEDETVL